VKIIFKPWNSLGSRYIGDDLINSAISLHYDPEIWFHKVRIVGWYKNRTETRFGPKKSRPRYISTLKNSMVWKWFSLWYEMVMVRNDYNSFHHRLPFYICMIWISETTIIVISVISYHSENHFRTITLSYHGNFVPYVRGAGRFGHTTSSTIIVSAILPVRNENKTWWAKQNKQLTRQLKKIRHKIGKGNYINRNDLSF
jgi:hypothetical protein